MMNESYISSIKQNLAERVSVELVYPVRVDTDERSSAIFGYFSDPELAKKLAKGKGWYGADGRVETPIEGVLIHFRDGSEICFPVAPSFLIRSEESYLDKKKMEARAAALRKLSPKDIEILGIKL
jgi:hypothetical protein